MKELIKSIRSFLNMSQTEFAESLNISFATVNRWENGRAIPNKLAQSTLYELCKMNNVPVYDMVLDKINSKYHHTMTIIRSLVFLAKSALISVFVLLASLYSIFEFCFLIRVIWCL